MIPVDTGRKLNVYTMFRRHPGRLLNVLCTFNLLPVSAALLAFKLTVFTYGSVKNLVTTTSFNQFNSFKTIRGGSCTYRDWHKKLNSSSDVISFALYRFVFQLHWFVSFVLRISQCLFTRNLLAKLKEKKVRKGHVSAKHILQLFETRACRKRPIAYVTYSIFNFICFSFEYMIFVEIPWISLKSVT